MARAGAKAAVAREAPRVAVAVVVATAVVAARGGDDGGGGDGGSDGGGGEGGGGDGVPGRDWLGGSFRHGLCCSSYSAGVPG